MRVLIDLTNSPHVPFFAPIVSLLREDGHRVHVTARRFAQTVELAELHGLQVAVIGSHGGAGRAGKARAAADRTLGMLGHVRREQRAGGRFDVAMSHGSTDAPVVARALGIPHVTLFDYEWARAMHRINCRASWRVVVPDAIPADRLDAYGAAGKVVQYPGLKEEYYLDPRQLHPERVRDELGVPADDRLVLLRPPASMALYHRGIDNHLFGRVIDRAAHEVGVTAVVLARTPDQEAELRAAWGNEPAVLIPRSALDGPSLVAASDVVVSAGGTMNREAAALGVPVYTVFAGRLGGVDEGLLASGRLRSLDRPEDVDLAARGPCRTEPCFRDPRRLLEIALDGLPVSPPGGSQQVQRVR